MAVLRATEESNLCNAGAVAVLVVNGSPAKVGMLDATPLQVSVQPRDVIVAVVHTVPLDTKELCSEGIGALDYSLSICELE